MTQPQIEFVLPFSKKKVVMKQPNWGIRRELKRLDADTKGEMDDQDKACWILSKTCEVDGVPLQNYMDLDSWFMGDITFAIEKWNTWDGATDESKNVLPTK